MGRSHSRHVKKVTINGVTYGSGSEAKEGEELRLKEAAGIIKGLVFHRPFPLSINGKIIGKYTPDYCYFEKIGGVWKPIVHEHKGRRTAIYNLRIKIFRACYPNLIFRETGSAVTRKPRRRRP